MHIPSGLRKQHHGGRIMLSFPSKQWSIVCAALLTISGIKLGYSQTFSTVSNLPVPLAYQTATLLQNGSVLIAGGSISGSGPTNNASIYNPTAKSFAPTLSHMNVVRYAPTATLLPNGQVLIAGGGNSGGNPIASAEVYDPTAGTFTTVGSLATARNYATATLLNDGTVLVAGGVFQTGTATAEIYNPTTKAFSATTGTMTTKRVSHTATLLSDGTVLIAGGIQNYSGEKVVNTAERYNPSTRQFTAVGNMSTARCGQTATRLNNGTVLITGGSAQTGKPIATAEIFNPATNSFSAVGSLHTARSVHAATLLRDGTVLIAGGSTATLGSPTPYGPYTGSTEIYTPSTSTFTTSGTMVTPRGGQTATLLSDGTVLEAGGGYGSGGSFTATTELYSYPFATGYINPKYKVVGIAYAVPGTASYVQYTNTTMLGTSTSTSSSFGTNLTTSESVCGSIGKDICGGEGGVSITGTYTNSFTQESDTSSSYAVNQTTSLVNQWSPLTGPCLDHGSDVIYVWVNPNVWYTVTTPGTPLQWNGYTYDLNDDSNNMEVIPLRLSELLNPTTIDSYTQGRLQRVWAKLNTDGSSPAITNNDLLNIAAQDPFSNPNYAVTLGSDYQTTTDSRFTQTLNVPLFYDVGGSYEYNWSYTGTTTAGKGAKTTYSDTFALEEKFGGSAFWLGLSYDLKQSTEFTWVDQWNASTTSMTGQSAKVHITGPSTSSGCADEYNVYADNVYGTFMVSPVPAQ
jgi:hypothetical protein